MNARRWHSHCHFVPVVSARPLWKLVTIIDRIQMRGKGFLRPPRTGEARNDPSRRQSHRVKLSIRPLKIGNPIKPRLHPGDVRIRVVVPLVEAGILPANQALLGIEAERAGPGPLPTEIRSESRQCP